MVRFDALASGSVSRLTKRLVRNVPCYYLQIPHLVHGRPSIDIEDASRHKIGFGRIQ